MHALREIPLTPAVLGLALDFSVDLRCDNACYFQRGACGAPVETTCWAGHTHVLCGSCANRGCQGCARRVCTLCPRQLMTCAWCHEEVGVCNHRSCPRPKLTCCDISIQRRQSVCGACVTRSDRCDVCGTGLCRACAVPIQCSTEGCTSTLSICGREFARARGWKRCSTCELWECASCTQVETKCGCGAPLCTQCAKDVHCAHDHRLELVDRVAKRNRYTDFAQ